MGAYIDSLDIANRALDHLGLPYILDVAEDSLRNSVISKVYDKLREAEFERNVWRFAKRKVWLRPVTPTSRLLQPEQWNVNETYLAGSIVADPNGDLWITWQNENYGNEPGVTAAWDSYYGPMAVDQYNSAIAYNAGELVWQASATAGAFVIFLSTQAPNSETPNVADAWASTTLYGLEDRVLYSGTLWRSLITVNQNITPVEPPAVYSSGVIYNAGDKTVAGDGFVYAATTNATIDIDPLDDDGTFWTKGVAAAWTAVPTQFSASNGWLPIFANMVSMGAESLYVTPQSENGRALNAFRFPAGIERRARITYRQKAAADDWEPHGDYITSSLAMLLYEFVANIKDVRKMDAMFCEGLALRIALETCERLTGSDTKIQILNGRYNKVMIEARAINGIEEGPEEPDTDEYLTVREGGYSGYSDATTNFWV